MKPLYERHSARLDKRQKRREKLLAALASQLPVSFKALHDWYCRRSSGPIQKFRVLKKKTKIKCKK